MDVLNVKELNERSELGSLYNEANALIVAVREQLVQYQDVIDLAVDEDPLIARSHLKAANTGLKNANNTLKIWNDSK
jgi:hypothetical protein